MTTLLGIDTGGTFTDAVLFDPTQGVIASAKALTTRQDLLLGIRQAVEQLFIDIDPTSIGLVSLSTTLATNAIVENHGQSTCLLLIGQDKRFLQRAKLKDALAGDPVVFIPGGHNAHGEELKPLAEDALIKAIQEHACQVQSFAIAGYFSVRNSAHEKRSRDLIQQHCDLPVTCSHELSVRLDAPRRALTTLLNARLIPLLHNLIHATERLLEQHQIQAPLMIVRGDGALVSAQVARQQPVETILSGPAASVVGAAFLTKQDNVLVSDIGGTTSDIALLKNGRPALDANGATIGGWPTMVEAIALHTYGLGGDSEFSLGSQNTFSVGPQRAIPLSLFATQENTVTAVLKKALDEDHIPNNVGFVFLENSLIPPGRFTTLEQNLISQLQTGPRYLDEILEDPRLHKPLHRLRQRRIVQVSAFTSSDACHVLNKQQTWSRDAAVLGADLWIRYLHTLGMTLDIKTFSQRVIDTLVVSSSQAIIKTVLEDTNRTIDNRQILNSQALSRWLTANSESITPDSERLLTMDLSLNQAIVAVGASAHVYYPTIAKQLNTQALTHEHADVCNAVGAVASGVIETVEILISAPQDDIFRVHLAEGITDFDNLLEAQTFAETEARRLAHAKCTLAGGVRANIHVTRRDNIVQGFGGHNTFLESRITAKAAGRARISEDQSPG